ncbi:MAG: polysaccharide deacetylase family protein [Candidatus Hydrogenedentes bacterium]|nr:polysaccharide deacetylase family protein [Candidatus Hydrogenedentota bacterium]
MSSARAAKTRLKRAARAAAAALGPSFPGAPAAARILTYHSIGYRAHEMNVTPEAFADQMAWLASHTNVIPLAEAATGGGGVALTFDDGYQDNFIHALPILERYGFPATIFVVSGCLGAALPGDLDSQTGRILSPEEIQTLRQRGIAIGGHTRTHPRLSALSPGAQSAEIGGCKADLEAVLGETIDAFAYPYGSALDYDASSRETAIRAGFSVICSNRYGPVYPEDAPLDLRRIWIDSTDTLASFEAKVSGRLDLLRIQDSAWGIRARRLLNTVLAATARK